MSPPPVLTIEDRQSFRFRQVFWLWDDLTPDPFPVFVNRYSLNVNRSFTISG